MKLNDVRMNITLNDYDVCPEFISEFSESHKITSEEFREIIKQKCNAYSRFRSDVIDALQDEYGITEKSAQLVLDKIIIDVEELEDDVHRYHVGVENNYLNFVNRIEDFMDLYSKVVVSK